MFDIAWSEMLVIVVIAIIVIGPKDLPRMMRAMGGWMRKARGMANEFRLGIDQLAREADLEDLRRNATAAKNFDPNQAIKKALDPAADPAAGPAAGPAADLAGDLAADPSGDLAGDIDDLTIPPSPVKAPGQAAGGAGSPGSGKTSPDAGKKS